MPLPINISDLLRGAPVEWERLEFKEGWNPLAVLHTLCAFANDFHNLGGGYVVVGVAEVGGQPVLPPVGLGTAEMDAIQKEVLNLGHSAMQPQYHPIIVPAVVKGKQVLVLWAPGGQTRPYKAKLGLVKDAKDYGYFMTRLPVHPQARAAAGRPNRSQVTPDGTGEGARSESGSESRSEWWRMRPEWRSEWGLQSVHDRIMAAISAAPLARSEIANAIGHKSITGALRRALAELVAAGWVELTVPAKPNSRLQKYRTTGKGRS